MKSILILSTVLSFLLTSYLSGQIKPMIEYNNKTPEGLVGNGKSVVKVNPAGFQFHTGGSLLGKFKLIIEGSEFEISSTDSYSEFFPGGVYYKLKLKEIETEFLFGATEEDPFIIAIRVKGKNRKVELKIDQSGHPELKPAGIIPIKFKNGIGEIVLSTNEQPNKQTFEKLKTEFANQYRNGFSLNSPNQLVDRAIPFNRYLLDLGFDGKLHVCEIFRWRDVWSRDLGSGLVPGSMASGQFSRARTTLEYDLNRYAIKNPKGLKATEDPSQGGSAEGTAWLTKAVWNYYLLTGDKNFLIKAKNILLPWVNAWIDRDYRNEGLLIDVTEWMDHSRFFLFPDGARILYSNALFVDLLNTFSKVENELGETSLSQNFINIRNRFIKGINNVLWNESTNEYDNLSLWNKRDARSSSAENMLAILSGLVPQDRIQNIFKSVEKNNWRNAGSTTIYPPMTHVELYIDHNYKMWPWWNAVEAKVRFLNGDIKGGIHLLECCSKTLEDEHYPGLMEELTSIDGVTEGGNAFLSAAGSYQNAIVEGLLGIEILEPGCKRIKITPNTPMEWKNWNATIPLPEGEIILIQKNGKLKIQITDPRVKFVETKNDVVVTGAKQVDVSKPTYIDLNSLPEIDPIKYPEFADRNSVVFYDSLFSKNIDFPKELSNKIISVDQLARLNEMDITALIIPGNALPLNTSTGIEVKPIIDKFLNDGKAIVFYGATMNTRGTMGETAGIIDWYDYRRNLKYISLDGWKIKKSPDGVSVSHEKEFGLINNWFDPKLNEDDWENVNVPSFWENKLGQTYDGWGWYRIHFKLNANLKGKTILFDLGEIDDADWTYLNGVFIGSENGWQKFRRYVLKPNDPIYNTLIFGDDNVIAIQVFDGGGTGGLYIDSTKLSVETDMFSWMPTDAKTEITLSKPERFGVISWGAGDFFNSWETSRGCFGFKIDGNGVEFCDQLSELSNIQTDVQEALTDFATSKPLIFQPLAFTKTNKNLLIPDEGERYPCLARIVNTETKGEFIIIPASITRNKIGQEVLKKLRIN
jgi:hypothetical protein